MDQNYVLSNKICFWKCTNRVANKNKFLAINTLATVVYREILHRYCIRDKVSSVLIYFSSTKHISAITDINLKVCTQKAIKLVIGNRIKLLHIMYLVCFCFESDLNDSHRSKTVLCSFLGIRFLTSCYYF